MDKAAIKDHIESRRRLIQSQRSKQEQKNRELDRVMKDLEKEIDEIRKELGIDEEAKRISADTITFLGITIHAQESGWFAVSSWAGERPTTMKVQTSYVPTAVINLLPEACFV